MKISDIQSSQRKYYLRFIFCTTTIVVAVGWWYLLDSGFCVSQMRHLSNRELILRAIRYNVADMKIDGTDESIEIFLKENPKCCYVNRNPNSKSVIDRLSVCFGFKYSEVTLNYEKAKPRSQTEPFHETYISISSCGDSPHIDYGMSHSTPQQIY